MNKATVCIDARMILTSGIGRYIRSLVPYILPEFNVVLLGKLADIKSVLEVSDFTVINFSAPIYSVKEQLRFPFIIPKCDLFWSPHFNVPALPIRAKKRLVTIHDIFHLDNFDQLGPLEKIYAQTFYPLAANRSDKVIAISEFTMNRLIDKLALAPSHIKVIYNGVSMGEEKLPDISDRRDILFVGNVKPHKNLKVLLKAFKDLLLSGFTTNLIIVGKKDGFINGDTDIKHMIESDKFLMNHVTFTSEVSEQKLLMHYQQARVLVFPSRYEGFGLPPLEAMANGCPVICSDIPPCREVCGPAAVYFPSEDAGALSIHLKRLLKDDDRCETLIQMGLKRATNYSWAKAAKEHIQTMKALISNE